MEGRCEGSLDQQRVIKLSIGLGKFLISGGRVPKIEIRRKFKQTLRRLTVTDIFLTFC